MDYQKRLMKEIEDVLGNAVGIFEVVDFGSNKHPKFSRGQAQAFLAQYNEIVYATKLLGLYERCFNDGSSRKQKMLLEKLVKASDVFLVKALSHPQDNE